MLIEKELNLALFPRRRRKERGEEQRETGNVFSQYLNSRRCAGC